MTFSYDIRRKRDGVLTFHADITTVLVDLDKFEPVPIDAELRAIFERFLSG